MKSIMLSGATKVISGDGDKVGVGGIDYWATAYDGYMRWITNGSYDYLKSNDDGTNDSIIEWKTTSLTANYKYRAAISWLNNGTYTYNNLKLGTDYDMYVYNPSGTLMCSSKSYYNPYEVCNFTANISGAYVVRIVRSKNNDTTLNMSLGMTVNRY